MGKVDDGNVPDPENCIAAITRIPKPFQVKVSDRAWNMHSERDVNCEMWN